MDIIAKHCIMKSGSMWAQQSLAQQSGWRDMARRHAAAKQHLLGMEWQVLSSELAKIECVIGEQKSKPAPLTMKSAEMDDEDLECFSRLWAQPSFGARPALAARRADVGTAPGRFVLRSEKHSAVWIRTEPTMPAWAAPFVKYRSLFNASALVVDREGGGREIWKVVFAVQRPKAYLALCPLKPVPAPSLDDLASPLYPLQSDFIFAINFADCISAADLVVGARDELRCLFRLVHEGGVRVTSDMQPLRLSYFLAGEHCDLAAAELDGDEEEQPKAKGDSAFEKLVTTTLPWLQHLDFKQGLTAGRPSEEIGADEWGGGS